MWFFVALHVCGSGRQKEDAVSTHYLGSYSCSPAPINNLEIHFLVSLACASVPTGLLRSRFVQSSSLWLCFRLTICISIISYRVLCFCRLSNKWWKIVVPHFGKAQHISKCAENGTVPLVRLCLLADVEEQRLKENAKIFDIHHFCKQFGYSDWHLKLSRPFPCKQLSLSVDSATLRITCWCLLMLSYQEKHNFSTTNSQINK